MKICGTRLSGCNKQQLPGRGVLFACARETFFVFRHDDLEAVTLPRTRIEVSRRNTTGLDETYGEMQ